MLEERRLKTTVEAKVTVAGTHYWADAPAETYYLRDPHRHQFVIRARAHVPHDDRAVEFIYLAHQIESYLRTTFKEDQSGALVFEQRSCEMIAALILREFDLGYCAVWEDDENGAIVEYL